MSNQISLSASMRNNLLSLQNTQKLFDMTQERLSTGKKVNSALDNPASYFTSQSLTARAGELELVLNSIGQSIQAIQAADNGIETLLTFTDQAQSLINQALETNNIASSITGNVSLDLNTDLGTVGGIAATDEITIRQGDAYEVVGLSSLTLNQTAESIGFKSTNPPEPAFFSVRLTNNDDGTYQEIKVEVPAGQEANVTVDDLLNQINQSFGYNEQGEPKVIAELVDGKFSITSTDREKSLTIIEGNNGASPLAPTSFAQDSLGLDPGYVVNMAGFSKDYTMNSTDTTYTNSTLVSTAIGAGPIEIGLGGTLSGATPGIGDVTGSFNIRTIEVTADMTMGDLVNTINAQFGDELTASIKGGSFTLEATDPTQAVSIAGNGTMAMERPPVGVVNTYELMTKINQLDGLTAELTNDGKLKILSEDGSNLIISNVYNYDESKEGIAATALGILGTGLNGTEERAALAQNFDSIVQQIDEVNTDTGYQGVNLLNGDTMTVYFNEYRTTSLSIEGVVYDANGLGLTDTQNNWETNEDIEKSLAQIDYAAVLLKNQASEFGYNLSSLQTREAFTQDVENILVEGSDKLVLADMNEEAANMLALQVRQQLGTNALSLSSQAQQSVLNLFG